MLLYLVNHERLARQLLVAPPDAIQALESWQSECVCAREGGREGRCWWRLPSAACR